MHSCCGEKGNFPDVIKRTHLSQRAETSVPAMQAAHCNPAPSCSPQCASTRLRTTGRLCASNIQPGRQCREHHRLACTRGDSLQSECLGSPQLYANRSAASVCKSLQSKSLSIPQRRRCVHVRAAATVGHQADSAEGSHLTQLKAGNHRSEYAPPIYRHAPPYTHYE